jgi:hypothetical protein
MVETRMTMRHIRKPVVQFHPGHTRERPDQLMDSDSPLCRSHAA